MSGNTDKAMQDRIGQLENRLSEVERELALWRNLQIAPESGGGGIQMGGNSVVLRINSLTGSSAQMP